MSKIGYGYGSEWHLLRYLGYHREALNEAVTDVTHAETVTWLDSPFSATVQFYDAEIKQLNFLPEDDSIRQRWSEYWPQTGNPQNWDAVGRLHINGKEEWLLVEAKAHTGEIESSCGAKEHGGLPLIKAALDETKQAMNISADSNWLSPYYQYANRLAALHFLLKNNRPARLLFIYFLGDSVPNKDCPQTQFEWEKSLQVMYNHLELKGKSELEDRVHKLFLHVCPT